MKNKFLKILSIFLIAFITLFITGCNKEDNDLTTRVTIGINPSVEFMVDEENKVVSVTALNDDGSLLIAGEAFVGKTLEDATELVISLAVKTGYLVQGNVTADENNIKVSVSGDTKYAEEMYNDINEKVSKKLEELDIEGKIEQIAALNKEALQELAKETTLFTDEEIEAMSEEELYKVISASRIETALLLTEDMRKAYYSAKEYEISFTEREETAKIIQTMGSLYNLVYMGYKTALDVYSEAITRLDEFRYNTIVSPESDYQKSLMALREAKIEFLKQRSYTASLDINGEEYASATVTLQAKEENYNKLLETYEALGTSINESLEQIIQTLRNSEEAISALEDKFSDDITAKLNEKAQDLETKLNEQKDSFFTEFENAHKEDIQLLEERLKQEKQSLIDAIDSNSTN